MGGEVEGSEGVEWGVREVEWGVRWREVRGWSGG